MKKLCCCFYVLILTACFFDDSSSGTCEVEDVLGDVCNATLHYINLDISQERKDSLEKGLLLYHQVYKRDIEGDYSYGPAQLDVVYRDFSPTHPDFEKNQSLADTAEKGLVKPHLEFAPVINGVYDMLDGVFIKYNEKNEAIVDFNSWFSDTGEGLRINAVISLPRDGDAYVYHADEFFPLDTIECVNHPYTCKTYGKQSLNVNCFSNSMTEEEQEVCKLWKECGGEKDASSAKNVVDANPLYENYFHNGNFTMMTYAKFQYKAGYENKMSFTCGGNCWVYVDGVLVVDLGGLHKVISEEVDFDQLAENNLGCQEGDPLSSLYNCDAELDHWRPNSWHHIHLFYANRQSWNAEFEMKFSLDSYNKQVDLNVRDAFEIVSQIDTTLYLVFDKELDEKIIRRLKASNAKELKRINEYDENAVICVYRNGQYFYFGIEDVEKVGFNNEGYIYKIKGGSLFRKKIGAEEINDEVFDSYGFSVGYLDDGVLTLVEGEHTAEGEHVYDVGYWQYDIERKLQKNDKIGFLYSENLDQFADVKVYECR